MEALKAIGSFLGLLLGFALLAGAWAAVVAVGFFLGWVILALFIIGCIIYGIYAILKS